MAAVLDKLLQQISMAQTVLITGASQGIGKATALELAQHGCNMVLAAREPARLGSSSNRGANPGSARSSNSD